MHGEPSSKDFPAIDAIIKKYDEQKGYHTGRGSGGNGIQTVIGQKHSVGKFHNRDGGRTHDKRNTDLDHRPVTICAFPVFQNFQFKII